MPTADTPVPRQLSEEERALWEKATALEAAAVRYDDIATTASKAEHHAAMLALVTAQEALDKAASPAVILSLLTALSSEREAGERDKARLDWMQERAAEAVPVFDMDPEAEIGYRVRSEQTLSMGDGAELRDAIDAAMRNEPDPLCPKCQSYDRPCPCDIAEYHAAQWNECDDCDGCGWVEGGVALKTTCAKCDGAGQVRVPSTSTEPAHA